MGNLFKEQGDLKQAEFFYRRALKAESQGPIHVVLGDCLVRQGQWKQAVKAFKKAVQVAPDEADEALYNLGLIARKDGQYEQAVDYFEQALALDDQYVEALQAQEDCQGFLALQKG